MKNTNESMASNHVYKSPTHSPKRSFNHSPGKGISKKMTREQDGDRNLNSNNSSLINLTIP